MASYAVSTERRLWRFHFRRFARHFFRSLPLNPGESVVLTQHRGNGVVAVLDVRYANPEREDG